MRAAIGLFLVIPCLAVAGPKKKAPKAPPPTLCTADEEVVANCVDTDKKKKLTQVASVCASKGLDKTKGTLQFRYGKPGAPAELTAPESPSHPSKVFKFEYVNLGMGYSQGLKFMVQDKPASFDFGEGKFGDGIVTVSVGEGPKAISLSCMDSEFNLSTEIAAGYGIPTSEE
jgi:hypothetical protein